jgi:broad specificity phosphatase PhoE
MLYLVRHGEAAASWGDHPNPGLSETGRGQAEAVARHLQDLGVKQIVTSPMQRCRETARPLEALMGVEGRVLDAVSEISTPDGVSDRVAWLRTFMAGTWDVEAQSHIAWRDTMLAELDKLPDQTVVFSHFVAINAIVSALQGAAHTGVFRPGYCSVTSLTRENGQLKVQQLGGESETRVL